VLGEDAVTGDDVFELSHAPRVLGEVHSA
jgi:hypothetical protein